MRLVILRESCFQYARDCLLYSANEMNLKAACRGLQMGDKFNCIKVYEVQLMLI